jgi:hypothetical protein
VKILKKAAAAKRKPDDAVAIISYDEKPGIQAIATTSPDLPRIVTPLILFNFFRQLGKFG